MKKITSYFKSKSHPKIKYKTQRFKNGKIFCNCPGFMFNHYKFDTCIHSKLAQKWTKT